MSDIELIIKIPEDEYAWLKEHPNSIRWSSVYTDSILNGTPLPKSHGRLIDADALLKKHPEFDAYPFPSTTINNAPTIIESGK